MSLTNSTFNSHKIKIYCCLGDTLEEYRLKSRYVIKDCEDLKSTLTLNAALFDTICRFCLDDADENYALTNSELEQIVTYIENHLH